MNHRIRIFQTVVLAPQRNAPARRTARAVIRLAICVLTIWLLPQSAQCFYNPATGRWLSRDPIGEPGGQNVFATAYNNTISQWDSFGLCPCCCCAQSLDLFNVRKLLDDVYFGHSFRLAASLQYKKGGSGDCGFTWLERSADPPQFAVNHGAKPNEWYDVTAMDGSIPKIVWDTHPTTCPNLLGVWMPDSPYIEKGPLKHRILEFEFTLRSSADCPCAHKGFKITATQTLEMDQHRVIRQQELLFRKQELF